MLCKSQGSHRSTSDVAKQGDGKQKQKQSQKLCGTWHNVPSREKNQVLSVFSHALSLSKLFSDASLVMASP